MRKPRTHPQPPRSSRSRPARARAFISSQWPSLRSTAWAAASASAPAPKRFRLSRWFRRRRQLDQQDVFDYCVDKVSEKKELQTPTSRAASSASRCLSSPAPAQAAPRPATHASSPSCSATRCISPTPPAAPPSGATRALPTRTAQTQRARAPHGATPCSRTTRSTASACTSARRPSVTA